MPNMSFVEVLGSSRLKQSIFRLSISVAVSEIL